jgi:hypothetical protein
VLLISWQQIKGKAPRGFLPVPVSPTLAHKYAHHLHPADGVGGRQSAPPTDQTAVMEKWSRTSNLVFIGILLFF